MKLAALLLLGSLVILTSATEHSDQRPKELESKTLQKDPPSVPKPCLEFAAKPYFVGKLIIPRMFNKELIVAGKWGIIIPAADYKYVHIDYEQDGLYGRALEPGWWMWDSCIHANHIPGWARPFIDLELFGVRGDEFMLFVTRKEIRWLSKEGVLSKSYDNPLKEKKGELRLVGMCQDGLVCISCHDGDSVLLLDMTHETHLLLKVKSLAYAAINPKGTLLLYIFIGSQGSYVFTVCSVCSTPKGITVQILPTTINLALTRVITGLRFIDEFTFVLAHQEHLINGTRDVHGDVRGDEKEPMAADSYQIDTEKCKLNMIYKYSSSNFIMDGNAYFGEQPMIYELVANDAQLTGELNDHATQPPICDLAGRRSITMFELSGSSRHLHVELVDFFNHPKDPNPLIKYNVSPTQSHVFVYQTVLEEDEDGDLAYSNSWLISILGLRKDYKAYRAHLVSEVGTSPGTAFMAKPESKVMPFVRPLPLEPLPKGPAARCYSQNAHLVRALNMVSDDKRGCVMHMALTKGGIHFPVLGFKTKFFPYQCEEKVPSQVYEENHAKEMTPIPNLLAFDICPDYRLFITSSEIVGRWKNGENIYMLNPLPDLKQLQLFSRFENEFRIVRMASSGLVCLHYNQSRIAIINLVTSKYFSILVKGMKTSQLWGHAPVAMNSKGTLMAYLGENKTLVLRDIFKNRLTGEIASNQISSALLQDPPQDPKDYDNVYFVSDDYIIVDVAKPKVDVRQHFRVDRDYNLVLLEGIRKKAVYPSGSAIYPRNNVEALDSMIRLVCHQVNPWPCLPIVQDFFRGIKQVNCYLGDFDKIYNCLASPSGTHLVMHKIDGESKTVEIYGLLDNYMASDGSLLVRLDGKNIRRSEEKQIMKSQYSDEE